MDSNFLLVRLDPEHVRGTNLKNTTCCTANMIQLHVSYCFWRTFFPPQSLRIVSWFLSYYTLIDIVAIQRNLVWQINFTSILYPRLAKASFSSIQIYEYWVNPITFKKKNVVEYSNVCYEKGIAPKIIDITKTLKESSTIVGMSHNGYRKNFVT